MLTYRYPLIAREGWMWIALAIVVTTAAYVNFGLVSAPLLFLVILLVYLFRDPHRKVPALPLGIVCPVDGHVIAVDKVFDAYLERTAICISIKMSFFDVYSAHSPMEGRIMKQWQAISRQIKPLATVSDNVTDINTEPRTFSQWVQSDEGDDIVLVVEAGTFLTKPHCYAQSGERIGQGQRCAFLRFGTQVDVLVPESSSIEVKVGDKVQAGTGIIATLVRTAGGTSAVDAVTNS